jgi:hypothetical protein
VCGIEWKTVHVLEQAKKKGEEAELHFSNFCMCVLRGVEARSVSFHSCVGTTVLLIPSMLCFV